MDLNNFSKAEQEYIRDGAARAGDVPEEWVLYQRHFRNADGLWDIGALRPGFLRERDEMLRAGGWVVPGWPGAVAWSPE